MMKYIEDKNVFKAVNFAAKMIKEGKPKGLSIYKAATYYKVSTTEVAHHLGHRGKNQATVNNKNREYKNRLNNEQA